jgi:tRNA threonylcarbamoyladenosine biosynthesis protein TsaE
MKKFITQSAKETQSLGNLLAKELRGGEVLCLEGDLGSGKTTFTQGLLQGLKIKGPYTSPTFVIMKHYSLKKPKKKGYGPKAVYHIDAYRIGPDDLINLGWKELIADKENIVIVEWSNRVRKILPKNRLQLQFKWQEKNKRQIIFS